MNFTTPIRSPEISRSAAELRPVVVFGFCAGVLIPAGVALREHGLAAWILAAVALSIASIALFRFQKEFFLLKGRATTIAQITDWQRTENSEGGYSYSIRYEFVGNDGNKYAGKETTQIELLQKVKCCRSPIDTTILHRTCHWLRFGSFASHTQASASGWIVEVIDHINRFV